MRRIAPLSILSAAAVGAAIVLTSGLFAADGAMNLTATTANVAGAPDEIRIEILQWSDAETRDKLTAAWTLEDVPPDPNARGGNRNAKGKGEEAEPDPVAPEVALKRAIEQSSTVGYLWSSERAGYSLRYASQSEAPDGSKRVLLITQRRLGEVNQLWDAASGTEAYPYEFSVIDLRLDANGQGVGKASIVGAVSLDSDAGMVALENYAAAPVVFENVRSAAQP